MTNILSNNQSFSRYILGSKWTWISIIATLLCWLYALAIDTTLNNQTPIHALADGIVPGLLRNRFSYDVIINVGTAILVSRFISAFIGYEESQARDDTFDKYIKQQQKFYDQRIKEVAQSSFRGVYQSRFPDELIDEVLHVGFDGRLIRENLSLVYKLRDTDEANLGVVVEASAEYEVVNISSEDVNHTIAISVPNPIQNELKDICQIIQYRKDFEVQDIGEAKKDFDLSKKNNNANIRIKLDEIAIPPYRRVSIQLTYTMAKEIEDTELMRTGIPSKGIKIAIHDETSGPELWIDAAAVHRCKLKDVSPPNERRVKEYRLSEFFLPNQGFIWFWKRRNLALQENFSLEVEGDKHNQEAATSET